VLLILDAVIIWILCLYFTDQRSVTTPLLRVVSVSVELPFILIRGNGSVKNIMQINVTSFS